MRPVALALLFLFQALLAGAADPASAVKNISVDKAEQLLKTNKQVVVLDVRTAEEFSEGHIAGAKNIDYLSPDFAKNLEGLDKSKVYLVNCASGRRSAGAAEQMVRLKFKAVYNLEGGMKGWQKAGKPVVK